MTRRRTACASAGLALAVLGCATTEAPPTGSLRDRPEDDWTLTLPPLGESGHH